MGRPFSYLNSENELVYVERGTSSPSAATALPFPRRSIVVSVNNEMENVIDAFWEISILILVFKERKKERRTKTVCWNFIYPLIFLVNSK